MKTLVSWDIEKRKEVLAQDISMVRSRISENEEKVIDDKTTLNALLGAVQQCDAFLKELDDDTPEEETQTESDEG